MHPQLTLIAAQQHIADLHRAVDHNRLVHTATTATSSPRPDRQQRYRLRRNPAAPTRCSRTPDRIGREPCADSATGMSGVMPTSLQRADSAPAAVRRFPDG
jgi:hypothetical protein